jgi:hypothetical protein
MSNQFNEPPLSLSRACKLPKVMVNGKSPNPSTPYRWATAGVRGVKLETWHVGGILCTSEAAVNRFLAAINGQPAPASPAVRSAAIDTAERELDDAGVSDRRRKAA